MDRRTLGTPRGLSRRDFLTRAGAVGALTVTAPTILAACGSGGSGGGGSTVKIGFIALTDSASVIMAKELGYYAERGVNVEIVKQASWPALRDSLLNGDIDAAPCLYSMPFSVATGVSGNASQKLKIAMVLNNNGQAITLKNDLKAAGYGDPAKAKAALQGKKKVTLAMTYPGGTHDTWLRYWLLAAGVDVSTLDIIPIPPPQMVANMKVGTMDGYSVGEPWNAVAVKEGIGFTTIASQDIWENHPEKALVVNESFASKRTSELKEVMGAILKASKWLDDRANRKNAAKTISAAGYVNAPAPEIEGRMLGDYDLGAGLGTKRFETDYMRFFRGGATNLPRHRDAIWFMAQYQRFGLLKTAPAYQAIAESLIMSDLYGQVAKAEGIPVPADDMAPFTVKLDGVTFNPNDPKTEADR
ncbi:MAG: ABC transporter substrate-binding protein [Actinobacteria bacterium]|nr:ABC transporter substrate-binding protein [Actinomycetota bacterium]